MILYHKHHAGKKLSCLEYKKKIIFKLLRKNMNKFDDERKNQTYIPRTFQRLLELHNIADAGTYRIYTYCYKNRIRKDPK